MSKYLLLLRDFEIVIVCDDSSSMNIEIDNTKVTRWNKLCPIVKIMIEIALIFVANGVDIYFLNREPKFNVKDPADIDQEFQTPPEGHTSLASVLKKIFQTGRERLKRNKKLLVLVATDGEPTDKYGQPNIRELKRVMTHEREVETTYVSFLVCTEDTEGVAYLDHWDKTMKNVDVNDDYKIQRDKIRQRRGRRDYPFSRGDYLVKTMMGAIVPELDHLDESD